MHNNALHAIPLRLKKAFAGKWVKLLQFLAITIGLGILAVPALGKGPSFDCKKATTAVEKLICGEKELAEYDQDLADLYQEFYEKLDDYERARLERQQVAWLKDRDSCVTTLPEAADQKKCVLKKMKERCNIVCSHSIVDDDVPPKRSREVKDFGVHVMDPANIRVKANSDVQLLVSNEASSYDVQASLTVRDVTSISSLHPLSIISADWKMDESSAFAGAFPSIKIEIFVDAQDLPLIGATPGKTIFLVMQPDGFRNAPQGQVPTFAAIESCANDRFKRCQLLSQGRDRNPSSKAH